MFDATRKFNDFLNMLQGNYKQSVLLRDELILQRAKKVVCAVIDDKLNALKEDYEPEKRIYIPIRLEIMKLENVRDEICVALDDEFLPKQRA